MKKGKHHGFGGDATPTRWGKERRILGAQVCRKPARGEEEVANSSGRRPHGTVAQCFRLFRRGKDKKGRGGKENYTTLGGMVALHCI